MSSTFGSYNTAYSGMYVNQAALTTTSTNLANINTTGASRVRVASTEKNTVSGGTSTGSGVSVASITRARDRYLDSTYRTQNAQNSYLSVKSGDLEYSDKVLTEFDTTSTTTTDSKTTTTTNSGVQTAVDDFFKKWSTLSTDASTDSTRKAVMDTATTLISTLTQIDGQLQQLQTDAVNGVKDGVKSLNDLTKQVADLNGQIIKAESGGGEASYLRDQRDTLLDNMSSLGEISTTTQSDGTLQVTLGGTMLVSGTTSYDLVVKGSGTTTNPLTVEVDGQNKKVDIRSGSIGAYLEDADQTGYETIDSSKIPYDLKTTAASSITTLRQSLNDLITTLATKVNALSTSGVDQNGNAGLDFFTAIDTNQPLSITNIQVNPKLTADSGKVVTGSSSASGDNTIANKISSLKSDTSCYQHGGVSLDITSFYKEVTSWIGTAGDTAKNSYSTQTSLVEQVDTKRQETSSISLDEEMSSMMREQKAYSASARVLSTLDSLIEGLIEDLG